MMSLLSFYIAAVHLCAATWGVCQSSLHPSAQLIFIPPLIMATENDLDPSEATPIEGELPPETTEPSDEATLSVEELQEKLAAAEAEAKTWRGRAEKATKTPKEEKKSPVSEEDIDWKIANINRINLVKDAYEQELADLAATGAKLTNALRDKALKLAESSSGVQKPQIASTETIPAAGVDRGGSATPELSSYDRALGVKPETVEKYRDYVGG